jgi:hypothetical protein
MRSSSCLATCDSGAVASISIVAVAQQRFYLGEVLPDLGSFAGVFPVWIAGPCPDPGQDDVGGRAEQCDVVEPGVELPLVGLAAGDEQVAVLVAGQQGRDWRPRASSSPVTRLAG